MINQQQVQKQIQKLSPQQIQLMKLLQVPTVALDQRIQEELEINPALEELKSENDDELPQTNSDEDGPTNENEKEGLEEEDFADELLKDNDEEVFEEETSLDDYLEDYLDDEDTIASYKMDANLHGPDEEEKTVPMAVEDSIHEYLVQQLGLLELDEHQLRIALQILGSIDDDGYLRREAMSICDDLAFTQGIRTSEQEVLELLTKIQTFDPAGIAARNLQECLQIQLRRKLELGDKGDTPRDIVEKALKLVTKYFEEFTKKHYEKLKRQLNLDDESLKDAVTLILHLNPKPSSGYNAGARSQKAQYIVPDFVVETTADGDLLLDLNSRNAPDLRVSDHYVEMLRGYAANKNRGKAEKEAITFIKQKIDAAKWFIDAIRQRQDTMFSTMYAIMNYQREFFLTGDEKRIKPMILKDIADITNLDISTVSRVANSKYVQTEFGTKSLKSFFSEALQMEDGEEVSTVEVKNILTEMISKESKKKPLSDEKLKEILTEKGYNIARRTVAKYREQLNIAVARLRKEL